MWKNIEEQFHNELLLGISKCKYSGKQRSNVLCWTIDSSEQQLHEQSHFIDFVADSWKQHWKGTFGVKLGALTKQ